MTTVAAPDRILDGALAAFLDFGMRRTNMAEIARRAAGKAWRG
jgi:AcrR family transcriptional regulator